MALKYNSTADIQVPKKIIEQVIGQEEGVGTIKKAAQQRRHVLLIGDPGTGKSMMGLALAELLPMEKLVDIISFPNPNDENAPLIRTVPAGQGRDLVAKARIQSMTSFKNQNVIMFVLVILAMILPWWARSHYGSDIMFAAFFLGGMMFLGAFVIFINLGKRAMDNKIKVPRLIVDNYKKKQAPFNDATGAHAGALLGDCLHDPYQSLGSSNKMIVIDEKGNKKSVIVNKLIDRYFIKNKSDIIINKENNYEAIFFPKNELSVLGETQGSVSPVEVLSSNRYDYDGEMIKLTTSENKELIVTPEHKIAIWKNGKIEYVEAKDIEKGEGIVAKSEDIIIDEQDIINTYDNPKLPLIAKVLGATFGDGGIFENLNGIFLSSSEKDAVEEFGCDIENIFKLKLNENLRIIEGGEYGHSWCYQNTNRNIIRFFLALGAPKGNKSKIELKIPNWIKSNEKRLYKALGEFCILKKDKYYELIEQGYSAESAMNLLNLSPNSLYLLLNHFGPKQEAAA